MSERVKFVAGLIAGFNCPAGLSANFMWDSQTKGLGLKASAGDERESQIRSWANRGLQLSGRLERQLHVGLPDEGAWAEGFSGWFETVRARKPPQIWGKYPADHRRPEDVDDTSRS